MIKEYVKLAAGHHFIIRKDSYDNRLSAFDELYEEAQQDFPNLRRSDAQITHYSGERYKRTWGIEFTLPDEPPEGYTQIKEVELTL